MTVATATPFKQERGSLLPWELHSCLHLQQSKGWDGGVVMPSKKETGMLEPQFV